MGKIRKLPPEVITHIAAGQVADKPSSIVKELIENSIDANAKHIYIEIEKSGLKLIRVVDDGMGMSKGDIAQAPLPHTTSKIKQENDLHNIQTYGFRGEALASIGAMGRLVIKSRQMNNSHGYEIEVFKGKLSDIIPTGIKQGTIIEVSNLYDHLPARKKDIKSSKAESADIVDTVLRAAIAHPGIEFSLYMDGKTILKVPVQSLRERIEDLLGDFISGGLIPINASDKGIEITGFVGTPQLAIKQKTRQYLFVNKRSVVNEDISSYIKHLYSTLLDPRLNPAFLVFINLSPDQVDINITPKKDKVTFFTQNELINVISNAIKPKLTTSNHNFEFELSSDMDKKTAFILRDAVSKWSVKPEKLKNKKFIQVDNTFLVTHTNSNLLIIDQHAAHERILYEQLLEVFNNKRHQTTKLNKKVKFTLPKNEFELMNRQIDLFSHLGFHITFKDNYVVVNEVPSIFIDRNIGQLLSEAMHDLHSNQFDLDSLSNKTLSFMACKGAIKAGEELTAQECENLLEKLFLTQTNYTCPHGRPVMIEIPLSQLHTAFRRK